MATIPTADELGVFANVKNPTTEQEAMLEEANETAIELVLDRCRESTVSSSSPVAIPQVVRFGIFLQGALLFDRRNSPQGVAGFNEFGAVRTLSIDPQVEDLLGDHLRLDGFASGINQAV